MAAAGTAVADFVTLALLQGSSGYLAERERFKAALDRNAIDLIVERIESEETLVELLDYNIDLGQGYLFGEPRPAREE